jgi:hypothetical protein
MSSALIATAAHAAAGDREQSATGLVREVREATADFRDPGTLTSREGIAAFLRRLPPTVHVVIRTSLTYVRVSLGTPEQMREFWRVWDLMSRQNKMSM